MADEVRYWFTLSATERRNRRLRRALWLSATFNAVLFIALLWRSVL